MQIDSQLSFYAGTIVGTITAGVIFVIWALLYVSRGLPPGGRAKLLKALITRESRAGNGVNAPKPEGARQRGLDTRAREPVEQFFEGGRFSPRSKNMPSGEERNNRSLET